MTIIQSLILGVIQGITEFIPISSTAHLLIGQQLLGIPASNAMFSFLVIVQLGTILSLVVYFWKDLISLVRAFFTRPFSSPENKLSWFIIFATIPALIFGYFLKSTVEALFKNPLLEAAIRLLITSVVLFLAELLGRPKRSLNDMNWVDAFVVGLAQVIAIFPGASRSGTTISAGMLRGLDRFASARFAFLMSIPVMLAAGGYQFLDLFNMSGIGSFIPMLAVGFVVASLIGWLAIKWLLKYLTSHSLYIFAAYCAIVGFACLVFPYI